VQNVRKVTDIVATIASDSGKQSSAISQVNIAVNNMEEMTQQNAALAEQTSAASVALNGKASEMVPLMDFFTNSAPLN
jgi:methyl-accepting chemotaxis protein